ncbi:hypothetical protein EGR_10819 [Echinococcus granulosus]|uniref:Uncharacterized protein n=1 Tax=Echinococcus granulosus TaxID=6210 RepID=W6TZZ0_ECHGR|nr:hypothetical protein EGR_10819 [Echinococcus granulosus]EUB54318.1 hypothetical protein EGR_10819 [Echinococcus granulosus]
MGFGGWPYSHPWKWAPWTGVKQGSQCGEKGAWSSWVVPQCESPCAWSSWAAPQWGKPWGWSYPWW